MMLTPLIKWLVKSNKGNSMYLASSWCQSQNPLVLMPMLKPIMGNFDIGNLKDWR